MSELSQGQKKPLLGDRAYDILKRATTTLLPALGALYIALAEIWGLPKAVAVAGTIAAVNTCLGILLGYSTKSYNKSDAKYAGEIDVVEDDGSMLYTLHVNGDPEELKTLDEVTFKVNGNPE